MARNNKAQYGTAFTVSIEAAEGVTTGISAADRARTIQVAVAKSSTADDIVQPGHIFPITAREGGVLVRAGHTEAGCDLAGMAGLEPSAAICEIMNDDGTMARLPELMEFAKEHGLKIGTIADLIHYRAASETLVERVVQQNHHHRPRRFCAARLCRPRQRRHPSGAGQGQIPAGEETWSASMNRSRCSTSSTRQQTAILFDRPGAGRAGQERPRRHRPDAPLRKTAKPCSPA
jgi:3,4-dihydroxy 2-butanone 4-phosphate synthase/GTP cyclohydrolase II